VPVTHTLQAAFTQSIGKAITLPPNCRSMYFFGSGGDGSNVNRVPGGPAPLVIGAPVYSASYVTVGQGVGIDTQNQRNSTLLAAGWTWALVTRTTGSGALSAPTMTDTAAAGGTLPANTTMTGIVQQNPGASNVYIESQAIGIKATLVLGSPCSNWHFLAQTYTGGATGTLSLAEYTNVPAGSTPATFVAVSLAAGLNSPMFGATGTGFNGYTYMTDVAWGMVVQGPMLQTDLAAMAASIRPWLARRGIVM
jgi:hypothetical protein